MLFLQMRQLSLSLVNQKKSGEKKGEISKAPTVKHSVKVHVYGCLSKKGFGNIYCFTNNLNAEILYGIYKATLLLSVIIFFGQGKHK